MASIEVTVDGVLGTTGEPPPYGPDRWVSWGKYCGGWDNSLHAEFEGGNHIFGNRGPGETQIFVKGMHEAEYSQVFATDTVIIAGTPGSPPNGTPMPDGNADISGPDGAEVTELA